MVKITRWGYKRVVSVERFGNVQVEAFGEVEDGEDPDDAFDMLRRSVDLKVIERKMRIEGTFPDDDEQDDDGAAHFGGQPPRAQQFKQGGIAANQIASGPVTRFSPNTGGNLAQQLQQQGAISSAQVIGKNGQVIAQARTMQQQINPASPHYNPNAEADSLAAARLTHLSRTRAELTKPERIEIPEGGRLQIDLGTHGAMLRLFDEDDDEVESMPLDPSVAREYMDDQGRGELSIDALGAVSYKAGDELRLARTTSAETLRAAINDGSPLLLPAFGRVEVRPGFGGNSVVSLFSNEGEELNNIGVSGETAKAITRDRARGRFVIIGGRYEYEPGGEDAEKGWVQLRAQAGGRAQLEYMGAASHRQPKQLAAGFAQIAIDRDLLLGRYNAPGLRFANDDEAAFWREHDRYAAKQPGAIPVLSSGDMPYAESSLDTEREPITATCPVCAGVGDYLEGNDDDHCTRCHGRGWVDMNELTEEERGTLAVAL